MLIRLLDHIRENDRNSRGTLIVCNNKIKELLRTNDCIVIDFTGINYFLSVEFMMDMISCLGNREVHMKGIYCHDAKAIIYNAYRALGRELSDATVD